MAVTSHRLREDIDQLRLIGHGALALVNAGFLLAIVAVVLTKRAQTAAAIQALFQLLAWLVGQAVKPLGTGQTVQLSNTLQPAGSIGLSGGSGTATSTSTAPPVSVTGGGSTSGASGGGAGGNTVLYPVTTTIGGISVVTGSSTTPVFAGQHPYTGINPDGSPIYAP